jgi:hypothetical protein
MNPIIRTTLLLSSLTAFCAAAEIKQLIDPVAFFSPRLVADQEPQEPPPPQAPAPVPAHPKSFRVYVAPQYAHLSVLSHRIKKYRGNMWGAVWGAEYKRRKHLYGAASFLWNQSHLAARGHRHRYWKEGDFEGVIGYTFAPFRRFLLTPFAGVGYRRVIDHKSFDGFDPRITLNYYQYYLPCGLLADYALFDDFDLGLNLEVMPVTDSRMYITNLTGVFWKLKLRPGYKAELPMKWHMPPLFGVPNLDLALVPFFKYWAFGACPVLSLPARKQFYWGVQLQFGGSF